MELSDCIPAHKYDTTAVENAAALGFPAINTILADLLEWVQDGNWPIAQGLFDLLALAGPDIVPHIEAIFDGDDEEWKYFVIHGLVKNLTPDVAGVLRPSVLRMAHHPTDGEKVAGVDEAARDVLAEWPDRST